MKIKVTEKMIDQLTKAQMAYAIELMKDDHWEHSDDGWDYCQGAVGLAHVMLHIHYDKDVKRLEKMLNVPGRDNELSSTPCDGICEAFYKLKPVTLDD